MPYRKTMSELSSTTQVAVAETTTAVASKWGMIGGTASSAYGFLTSSGGVVLIGLLVTILGFVINVIYQRRRDRREAEDSAFRRSLELAQEERRKEIHLAQLTAIKHTTNLQEPMV